jgi:hypothetical protein
MFEQARLERRRAGPLSLLAGGALTLLGYYGLPWWAGWPAYAVLAAAEKSLLLSERGVTWQVAFFAVAVLVNVLCWAAAVRLLIAAVRRLRPSSSTGDRRPPVRSRP